MTRISLFVLTVLLRLLPLCVCPLSMLAAFGPLADVRLVPPVNASPSSWIDYEVKLGSWPTPIQSVTVAIEDSTGTEYDYSNSSPTPNSNAWFLVGWQWLNDAHHIKYVQVVDANSYIFTYTADGGVAVHVPAGFPPIEGTPCHSIDFLGQSFTVTGAMATLDPARIDAVHRLTPNALSPGDTFSVGLTYYLGTVYPCSLEFQYKAPDGELLKHSIPNAGIGTYPRPAWAAESKLGTYTLQSIAFKDQGLRTFTYSRDGTILTEPSLPGAPSHHSLDFSILDYTVSGVPPMDVSIQTQPASILVAEGRGMVLRVVASGSELNYQWSKNGVELYGETGDALAYASVQQSEAGNYTVRIYNRAGGVTSHVAVVTVLAPVLVRGHPSNHEVYEGEDVRFAVEASGSSLSYQWYKDGVSIVGATNRELTLSSVQRSDAGSYRVEVFNDVSSAFSNEAVLTVLGKVVVTPLIVTQPQSQTAEEGSRVSISVAGSASVSSYQWFKDGVRIAGATSTNLVLDPVRLTDAGSYSVLVSEGKVSVTSDKATLVVRELAAAPKLLEAPKSGAAPAGQAKVLSVSALGGTISYQWYRNQKAIAGATGAKLTLELPSSLDNGEYTCVLTNSLGATTTEAAKLSFAPSLESNKAGRVANLSSRVLVGKDSAATIAGFSIEGTEPKTVLLRASGPALAPFGVKGVLPDPVLRLHDMTKNAELIAANEDWDYDSVASSASAVGAFTWAKASKDAALLVVLKPGLYAAEVSDHDGAEGVALIEVYEVGAGSKCVNISTRSIVETGDTAQVAGFVIQGTGVKTILVRASGPALSDWMGGTVPDPVLEIRSEKGDLLFSNDTWSGDDIVKAASATGAFAWKEGSLDAALLLSLPEGHYTAVVRDKTGTRGIGLVEIYEVNK